MAQPFKNRSEGRKKWEKGLDNSGNIEGNSNAILPLYPGLLVVVNTAQAVFFT
jgi:hypothetical protein